MHATKAPLPSSSLDPALTPHPRQAGVPSGPCYEGLKGRGSSFELQDVLSDLDLLDCVIIGTGDYLAREEEVIPQESAAIRCSFPLPFREGG